MSEPGLVVCAQCGAPGSGLVCAACGGALVKVCPACQFRNSLAKNYCDSCGTSIQLQPGPQAPVDVANLPQAGRSGQRFEETAEPRAAPITSSRPPRVERRAVPSPLLPSGPAYFIRSVLALVVMIAILLGAGAFVITALHENSPSVVVPQLAERYLNALSSGDYATAYSMLTDAARVNCSMDEFRLLRDTTPWTWANLSAAQVEPGAVVLNYDLSVKGRPTVRDSIVFVDDRGRWARPYDWPALLRAEQAFDLRDPDLAFTRAQEAVQLDPRDPMARGYLCEAAYFKKLGQPAIDECRVALELAQRYPTKLGPLNLYHLHALLGDAYMRQVKNYPEAVSQYTSMMDFPDMSGQDRCDLFLARAEAYAAMSRNAEAVQDLTQGRSYCAKPNDREFVDRRLTELQKR